MSELRDQIRAKTVGQSVHFATKMVEHEGMEIEVRQPTVAARSAIMKKSRDSDAVARQAQTAARKAQTDGDQVDEVDAQDVLSTIDYGKMQVWAAIQCAYVPGTDERLYSEEDFKALINQPTGSFVDKISTAAMNLMNVQPENDAKN